MKLAKLSWLLIMALILGLTGSALAEEKIGYVDLSRLFDEYNKTKAYDQELEGKHKGFEDERNKLIEKVREAQGKLGLLQEDQKAAVEADIEKMKADLLEFDRQKKGDLTKERNEKIREILLEIEKIVSDYAQKEGYTLILNDRVLIYGGKNMDLTEQILLKLNAQPSK